MAGIDIYEFTAGFRHMKARTDVEQFWDNPALVHAAVRHLAHQKGKKVEVVATNSVAIYQLTRWMEQIFPESEGHNGFGMWVSPSMYSCLSLMPGAKLPPSHIWRERRLTFITAIPSWQPTQWKNI